MTDVLGTLPAPPAVIPAPLLPPPALSLADIARFVIDEEAEIVPPGAEDSRWEAGVTFRREPLGHAGGWAPCSDASITVIDDCDAGVPPPVYLPFFLTWSSKAPLDQFQVLEYQARAERGLRSHEVWALERELWTGTIQPANPYLSKATGLTGAGGFDVVTPGAPVGARQGLALLDQAIADADVGIGMIHLSPYLMESMLSRGVPLNRENKRVLTPNGNWVVPGNGYQGSGPSGTARTSDSTIQWAYATDMLYLGRGTVQTFPDRYPTNWAGERVAADSDFAQSLVLAGTEVPMTSLWTAQRPWVYLSNAGLRAGILIDASLP